MKTVTRLLSTIVFVTLASCVSPPKDQPLSQADGARLRGASLVIAKRDAPPFAEMTAGKAALGSFGVVGAVAGASAMESEGKKIVEGNVIQDPADQMGRQLASALSAARGAKVSASSASKVKDKDPKAIARAYPGSDFVLDVRTTLWATVYFPTNWARYRVIYCAQLQLIETRTGRVIAQGVYGRVPEKTPSSPTRDELHANNAAILKRELQTGAAECTAHFKRNVLGL